MEIDYKTVRYMMPESHKRQYNTKIQLVQNNQKLSDVQRNEILKFANSCIAEGISPKRVCKYLCYLERFGIILGKPFVEATKEDLEAMWNRIIMTQREIKVMFGVKNPEKEWSPDTITDFKITLKKFYKITEGEGEEYPKKISFLRHTRIKPHQQVTPEELLQPQDVENMIGSTNNIMWRGFISLLWDSGMRLYEQLSLRIKDVSVTDSGIRLRCHGKTGFREYPLLVECYSHLTQWLAYHPYKEDRDALIFINTSNNGKGRGLNSTSVHMMLKEIGRKAGIQKPVYPKAFRRSRATNLSSHFTESEMKQYLGWVANSKVANHYVFRNGKQLENRIRKMHGMPTEQGEDTTKIKKCCRCMKLTPLGSKVCPFCAMPLSMEAAMEQKEKLDNLEALMPLINRMLEMQPLLKRWAEDRGINVL